MEKSPHTSNNNSDIDEIALFKRMDGIVYWLHRRKQENNKSITQIPTEWREKERHREKKCIEDQLDVN